MIRSDIKFYTTLDELDGSSSDDISIYWIKNGHALQHFKDPRHETAYRILKSREKSNPIKDFFTDFFEGANGNDKLICIEDDILMKNLVPALCKLIKFTLRITYVSETPFAVAFNSRLNESVKTVIRKT